MPCPPGGLESVLSNALIAAGALHLSPKFLGERGWFGLLLNLRYNHGVVNKDGGRRRQLNCPRVFGKSGWIVWVVLLAVLVGLVFFVQHTVRAQRLYAWTGEEQTMSQVVALWNLVAGQLRAMPETRADVPVMHSGYNPFGVNTFMEQEVEPVKRERICQMLHDAGAGWIRQEFPWEDIEIHGKGDFEDRRHEPYRSAWDKYDQIVELAGRYDLKIIARLSNPPAWSRSAGDELGSLAPPDNLEDYGDFVYAFASRYRDAIDFYQVWNEPNIYPEWGEHPVDPVAYTHLLEVGSRRIKAADPDAVILCGALAATIEMDGYPHGMSDFVFLQRMYDAGAKDYFDIMAVQGYGLWSSPTDRRMRPRVLNFSRPQYIRDIMVKNGDENKPIWMTEMNWNAIPAEHPAYPMFGRVTEQQQADYAVQAFRRAQLEWPWMGVMNVWFFKRASDAEKDQPMYYFRMVEPDFTPLPLYAAIKDEANRRPVMYHGYHQPAHWAVSYDGDWQQVGDTQTAFGQYRESRTVGDRVELAFSGTSLAVVFARGSEGRLSVSCAGEVPRVLEIGEHAVDEDTLRAVCSGLVDATHEASIVTLPSADGTGPRVRIAGYIVERDSLAVRLGHYVGAVAFVLGVVAFSGLLISIAVWRRGSC